MINLTPKKTKLCIGSMDKRIRIQKRLQRFQSGGQTLVFQTTWTVWAGVETRSGLEKFNEINIENVPTHIWRIRAIDDLTSEYWINYSGNNYRILSVETVNEGGHQLIYTRLTGVDSKGGAKS